MVWVVPFFGLHSYIFPGFLSVITGAKTGHGGEDWVLGAVTLVIPSFSC
jgi:hypothetical protein